VVAKRELLDAGLIVLEADYCQSLQRRLGQRLRSVDRRPRGAGVTQSL
jgi:hypothetical protein